MYKHRLMGSYGLNYSFLHVRLRNIVLGSGIDITETLGRSTDTVEHALYHPYVVLSAHCPARGEPTAHPRNV